MSAIILFKRRSGNKVMNTMEMKELTLQEMKEIEFSLLKEFRTFCEQNNIRYYLAYGTLLGAIRYKGFIPWDDDVDVLVPRKDYNRVIELFKDHENIKLYSTERNKKYGYPFAKLCDMNTLKIEGIVKNGVVQGVEIDIFPLDYWENDLEKAKAEVKRISKNKKWLNYSKMESLKVRTPLRQFVFNCMSAYGRKRGLKHWIDKINKTACSQSLNKTAYIGDKVWIPYMERDICPAEAFDELIEVEFEGEMFPAPSGYDTYLSCLYGDYLPEPPKEKQKTHHSFKAYRISE